MPRLERFRRNFHRPRWWIETVVPFIRRTARQRLSALAYRPSGGPSRLVEEDWDNVILLDGCRYDLFQEANTLEGDLSYRISAASATPQFLTRNFEDRELGDVVYVTANPMYRTRGLENTFFEVVDVWDEGWDDDLQTVPPDVMAEAASEAHERYPDKRIFAHFMQPHYPFIGESAAEIGDHSGIELTYREAKGEAVERDYPTVWELLEAGEVPRALVWEAYRENLEIALPHVETLLQQFDGRTVVTSDHGNALGERPFLIGKQMYGHPPEMRHDCLCKVPWLVVDDGTRKEIVDERVRNEDVEASDDVQDRLADLGYTDL